MMKARERPDRVVFINILEIPMKSNTSTVPVAAQAIQGIPLNRLVLAPENVRRTPADRTAHAELEASIRAHGLLENLVVRPEDSSGRKKFAVIAGGRRLAALNAIAAAGGFAKNRPVPCLVVDNGDAGELSLAENVVRVAMHPADQVVSFAKLMQEGATVATIAARFGISENTVEQRLRLGNAAPALLDAYRAGEMDLSALKAFAMTTDQERQRTVWRKITDEGSRPTEWNIRRMLTEERVSSASSVARFVGIDEYVAAGGPVMRDLFAEEGESGEWLEDPVLLNDLAMKKLKAEADRLATKWKWALPLLEASWSATSGYGRIEPRPGKPTAKEESELKRIGARLDELFGIPAEGWSDELQEETDRLDDRQSVIEEKIDRRASFREEDCAIGGCIVTIDRDGILKVIEGLVRAEDLPIQEDGKGGRKNGRHAGATDTLDAEDDAEIIPPSVSPRNSNTAAKAREEAGVGIGLADDLRAIRNGIVKSHLAGDFGAAFDLVLFQIARAVFDSSHYDGRDALDISFRETPDRPMTRMNDDCFAGWSPGEDILDDVSSLPLRWMEEEDDGARFAALRELPREKKEALFAAAVARTVRGQLSFEPNARPELEATVARLDIDFAKEVRPTAGLLWTRLRKDHLLAIAGETLGGKWARDRAKFRKTDLAAAMGKAFSDSGDGGSSAGLTAAQHEAAMAWTMPGFRAFPEGAGEVSAEAGACAEPVQGPEQDPGQESSELPGFLAEGA